MTIKRTTPQGHPYPEPSDAPLVPADIQALANSVNNRGALPVYSNAQIAALDPFVGMVIVDSTFNMLRICVGISPTIWQSIPGVYWTSTAGSTSRTEEGSVVFDNSDKYLKVRVGGAFQNIPRGVRIFVGGATPANPQDNDLWFKF